MDREPAIRFTDSGSLLLALPLEDYAIAPDCSLRIGACTLRRKRELHVTLLDAEAAARVTAAIGTGHVLELSLIHI